MSYYDNTIEFYDGQIHDNNQRIGECYQRIRKIEDDIEELRRIKKKVQHVDYAVVSAVDSTEKKLNGFPSLIVNPLALLKTSYFSNLFDVVKGNGHTRAKAGIESAIQKINVKIHELQGEIENLKLEIGRCNSNINNINSQKNLYIAARENRKSG